ncbi:triglyceride lipase [Hanseniaspora uvarum]|nr:triglyceride lipase [Hanseniaspora uvarum]
MKDFKRIKKSKRLFTTLLPILILLVTLLIYTYNKNITNITKLYDQENTSYERSIGFKISSALIKPDSVSVLDTDSSNIIIEEIAITEDETLDIKLNYHAKQNTLIPDLSDKQTIVNLGKMSQNAYVRDPYTGDWQNVTDRNDDSFGWDNDFIRGHIFKNEQDKIIIISFKGTSSKGLPGTGQENDTIENDKFNDNLLFSCCCARVTYLWNTVCDCYIDAFTCNEKCLEQNIRDKSNYYKQSIEIYREVKKNYPGYQIWTTGHSLGGALSSLVARTYGLVGVTFESPGDLLASQRLHLPLPYDPDFDMIWHIGNTADPIYMGTCNGASSSCNLAGYAMESRCHSGWEIAYDTVKELNWSVDVRKHRIKTVISDVLEKMEVPEPVYIGNGKGLENPCIECFDWDFVNPDPEPSTSSVSTTTTRVTSTLTTSFTTTLSSSCVGRNFVGWCTSYTTL